MNDDTDFVNDKRTREHAANLLENVAREIRNGDPNLLFVALVWRHQSKGGPGTLLIPGRECEGFADIVKGTRELHHSAIAAQTRDE